MALTLLEINRILNGQIRPDDVTLFDLVVIMSKRHSQYMLSQIKDTSSNDLAKSYETKVKSMAKRIINNDNSVFKVLHDNIIIQSANTLNYGDVKTFTNSDWENIVNNNMPEIFELIADVTLDERTAWQNL